MTCRDIDLLVISYAAGAPAPPEVAAHIAGCERCRRLARAIGQTPQVPPPSSERLKSIERGILAGLKPVRPLPRAGVLRFAFFFVLIVVAAIGAGILGTAGWHALDAVQRAAVFTALAASAILLAVSAERQIVPGSRLRLPSWLLVVAVPAVIGGLCVVVFFPRPESTFVATGLVCLRIGVGCAVAAALLLWLLLRRGAILSPAWTGATAGVLAGLSGLTVLEIFCPNLNRYHILVWHLGAVLASIAGGAAIGMASEYSGRLRSPGA